MQIAGIFTTINGEFERTAMHAVRLELLQQQADALGLPLQILRIPYPCPNHRYEAIMNEFTSESEASGVECFAFGDLFLEDIRKYREEQFQNTKIDLKFPLWKIATKKLAYEMIADGLKAVITCVDLKRLPSHFAGREFNQNFLDDLPQGVDPCGEFGEFHTFVYDSPDFRNPIPFKKGNIEERDGFAFADLIP